VPPLDDIQDSTYVYIADFRVFASSLISTATLGDLAYEMVRADPTGSVVVDMIRTDVGRASGEQLRIRTCQSLHEDRVRFTAVKPELAELIRSFYVMGPRCSTNDASCSTLAELIRGLLLRSFCYSSGGVRVDRSLPSAESHDRQAFINMYALLVRADTGNGVAEIAWLARSFQLGNAGNPPSGSCGSPLFFDAEERGGSTTPFAMYSCITADAPLKCKCHSAGPPAFSNDRDHIGFVRVVTFADKWARIFEAMKGQKVAEDLTTSGEMGYTTSCDAKSAPSGDTLQTPDVELAMRESETFARLSGLEPSSCVLQRLSDLIFLCGDVEIDPQNIRFTQNAISSRFREGGDVRKLVHDIRSDLGLASRLPKIQIVRQDGVFFSLDNRRLYAMKVAGVRGIIAQEVRVRRDLLRKKLSTTSSGQVVVFGDDTTIPHVDDVSFDEHCCDEHGCSHMVELRLFGSDVSEKRRMEGQQLVKILAKNSFPISDHFQPLFDAVMQSFVPSLTGLGGDSSGPQKTSKRRGSGRRR